jgi:hypothetical protein
MDGKIILKWILKETGSEACTEFKQLRIEGRGGLM